MTIVKGGRKGGTFTPHIFLEGDWSVGFLNSIYKFDSFKAACTFAKFFCNAREGK